MNAKITHLDCTRSWTRIRPSDRNHAQTFCAARAFQAAGRGNSSGVSALL